jgi:hypothetical protein
MHRFRNALSRAHLLASFYCEESIFFSIDTQRDEGKGVGEGAPNAALVFLSILVSVGANWHQA